MFLVEVAWDNFTRILNKNINLKKKIKKIFKLPAVFGYILLWFIRVVFANVFFKHGSL